MVSKSSQRTQLSGASAGQPVTSLLPPVVAVVSELELSSSAVVEVVEVVVLAVVVLAVVGLESLPDDPGPVVPDVVAVAPVVATSSPELPAPVSVSVSAEVSAVHATRTQAGTRTSQDFMRGTYTQGDRLAVCSRRGARDRADSRPSALTLGWYLDVLAPPSGSLEQLATHWFGVQ